MYVVLLVVGVWSYCAVLREEVSRVRQVVDGKVYDTDKGELVAEYVYGNPSSFDWVYEGLYRSNNGRWFVLGKGGAATQYGCQEAPNWWRAGRMIMPVSESGALEWCVRHRIDAEVIARYFAGMTEEA